MSESSPKNTNSLSLQLLIKLSGKNILMPFYHTVSDEKLPHIQNLYHTRNSSTFISDLEYFLRYFRPVEVGELIDISRSGKSCETPAVHLTFDDGLRECSEIIAPILKQKGFPATFFVNSGFVDNAGLFYRFKASLLIETINVKAPSKSKMDKLSQLLSFMDSSFTLERKIVYLGYSQIHLLDACAEVLEVDFQAFLKTNRPYMSTEEIVGLQRDGFSIGAHSIDHPWYKDIEYGEQVRQTTESMQWVKDNFSPEYHLFAFPFSDEAVSRRFFDEMFAGETPELDLSFGTSGLKNDFHACHLHRIPMEKGRKQAKDIIQREYWNYISKAPIQRNKIDRI